MKRLLYLVLFVSPALAGCGTSTYDDLYAQHLKQLELSAKFAVLWPGGTEIPGANLVVRIPKFFERPYNKDTNYFEDAGGRIDPERLYPAFLNPFPGLVTTYEFFEKDKNNNGQPAYLYIGVVGVPAGAAREALDQEVLAKLKTVAPDAAWQTVEAASPTGEKVLWKKIDARMPQAFYPAGKSRADAQNLPGDFQIWSNESPAAVVLLGWRAPEDIASKLDLSNLALLTAGTLAVKPPDAKPDNPELPVDAPEADAPPAGQ